MEANQLKNLRRHLLVVLGFVLILIQQFVFSEDVNSLGYTLLTILEATICISLLINGRKTEKDSNENRYYIFALVPLFIVVIINLFRIFK